MVYFENGELVEGAYVEIEGVKYPVHMPKYTGNTPVSAENLNKAQSDLEEKIELRNNILTAEADRQSITISQNWEKVCIPMVELSKNGDKLNLINSQVVIGSGISKVLVSMSGGVSCKVAGDKTVQILKNDEMIANAYEGSNSSVLWRNVAIAPVLVDVDEGDTFSLWVTSGQAGDVEILESLLTVQVVN